MVAKRWAESALKMSLCHLLKTIPKSSKGWQCPPLTRLQLLGTRCMMWIWSSCSAKSLRSTLLISRNQQSANSVQRLQLCFTFKSFNLQQYGRHYGEAATVACDEMRRGVGCGLLKGRKATSHMKCLMTTAIVKAVQECKQHMQWQRVLAATAVLRSGVPPAILSTEGIHGGA